MTREEAIKEIKSWDFLDEKEIEAIHTLIPELQSKDERIRRELIEFIQWSVDRHFMREDFHQAKRPSEWITYLEKQKEQIPYTDFVIKPHKGDDNNPYDMGVSEAQEYAIKRGFGVPFNCGEVYVDERHLTQTIGNILRWADEHPKEPHFTKRNALFDKCVENCDPKVMKKVSDEIDEMLDKEQKPEPVFKVGDKIKLKSEPNYPYRKIIDIGNGAYYFDKEIYLPFDNQDNWEKEQKPEDVTGIIYNAISEVCHTGNPKDFAEMNQTVFKVAQKVAEMCQKPVKWSNEDDKMLEAFLHKVEVCDLLTNKENVWIVNKLKHLRPQSKAELTLLDENIINAAVAFVEQNNHFSYWGGIDKHTVIKALRSLKLHWKPREWSEEDEKMRQSIIKDIEFTRNYTSAETGKVIEKYNEQINWLKNLSSDFKKKNEDVAKLCSNEWSKEDIEMYAKVLFCFQTITFPTDKERHEIMSWLKSLRPQPQGIYQQVVKGLRDMCDRYEQNGMFTDERARDFLGNVRVKCKDAIDCAPILDEPSWKPNKEQMEALKNSAYGSYQNGDGPALRELYEQLKKL